MDKKILHVRAMLDNHAMAELYSKTRNLYDKFSYDGARAYLKMQLYYLTDLREVEESEENFDGGDDNAF